VFRIVVHSVFQNSFLLENTSKYFFIFFIFNINTLKSSKKILKLYLFTSRDSPCKQTHSNQDSQFRFVSSGMAETFHANSKKGTKQNNFHLILNLGPFWIFRLNFGRNVPVSFHMFRFAIKKPLNQIEFCSI